MAEQLPLAPERTPTLFDRDGTHLIERLKIEIERIEIKRNEMTSSRKLDSRGWSNSFMLQRDLEKASGMIKHDPYYFTVKRPLNVPVARPTSFLRYYFFKSVYFEDRYSLNPVFHTFTPSVLASIKYLQLYDQDQFTKGTKIYENHPELFRSTPEKQADDTPDLVDHAHARQLFGPSKKVQYGLSESDKYRRVGVPPPPSTDPPKMPHKVGGTRKYKRKRHSKLARTKVVQPTHKYPHLG